MGTPICPSCGRRVEALNAALAKLVPLKNTPESPVSLVDCWTGFDTRVDTDDGVHPTQTGNEKLMRCWLAPLRDAVARERRGWTDALADYFGAALSLACSGWHQVVAMVWAVVWKVMPRAGGAVGRQEGGVSEYL
jgi:hypothetical protein